MHEQNQVFQAIFYSHGAGIHVHSTWCILFFSWLYYLCSGNKGFPGDSDGKESDCNAGDLGSIPGVGRSPGEGNDNPPQCSCLGNPMDRGAWQAIVQGVTKIWTQLSDFHSHSKNVMFLFGCFYSLCFSDLYLFQAYLFKGNWLQHSPFK